MLYKMRRTRCDTFHIQTLIGRTWTDNNLYNIFTLPHPLLNVTEDLVLPEMDPLVWFSEMGRPVLGRVIHIDPTLVRPVMVVKYRTVGTSQ